MRCVADVAFCNKSISVLYVKDAIISEECPCCSCWRLHAPHLQGTAWDQHGMGWVRCCVVLCGTGVTAHVDGRAKIAPSPLPALRVGVTQLHALALLHCLLWLCD